MDMKPNITLINILCRICGKEEKNCVSIFSEVGKKQAIQKKMRTCLNLTVIESDLFPKQICIACLNKLENAWNLCQLSKEGQIIIGKKLKTNNHPSTDSQGLSSTNLCGTCNLEVLDNHLGIGCEGSCQKWFHCQCINMPEIEYYEIAKDLSRTWTCEPCKIPQLKEQDTFLNSIEQKVKALKENENIILRGTSIISLAPISSSVPRDTAPVVTPEVPSSSEMLGVVPAPVMVNSTPVTFIQPSEPPAENQTTSILAPTPIKDGVYPESLIQVNPTSKPVVYTPRKERRQVLNSSSASRKSVPPPKQLPSPRRNIPIPAKRRALKEGNSSNVPAPKRSNQVCRYCNKSFPDDIIDHHVNLHLRQSFITCIECNKNFRSEEAMSRHRCGISDSINLDSDDELICL